MPPTNMMLSTNEEGARLQRGPPKNNISTTPLQTKEVAPPQKKQLAIPLCFDFFFLYHNVRPYQPAHLTVCPSTHHHDVRPYQLAHLTTFSSTHLLGYLPAHCVCTNILYPHLSVVCIFVYHARIHLSCAHPYDVYPSVYPPAFLFRRGLEARIVCSAGKVGPLFAR